VIFGADRCHIGGGDAVDGYIIYLKSRVGDTGTVGEVMFHKVNSCCFSELATMNLGATTAIRKTTSKAKLTVVRKAANLIKENYETNLHQNYDHLKFNKRTHKNVPR
jgi:hypothetical protein